MDWRSRARSPQADNLDKSVQAVMLDNGLMVTAVPTGPDSTSLAGRSGPAPAAPESSIPRA
jgi:hypothetical protein